MPGFAVHTRETSPLRGRVYPYLEIALDQKRHYQTVTPVLSDDERAVWIEREQNRYASGEYTCPPWFMYGDPPHWESWTYKTEVARDEVCITLDYGQLICRSCTERVNMTKRRWAYAPDQYIEHWESAVYRMDPLSAPRFPHLSKKQPGMIAYTPSEIHGHEDRQTIIRPGKYLERFAPHIDKVQRDMWAEWIRAYDGTLHLATSAEDIIAVYLGGPNSCMSHPLGDYSSHVHPVSVYGDSDLAVAYLGTLNQASARCVVWPDKKIYTRIYGDNALQRILEDHGYESGDLSGACVRAIRDNNSGYDRWVMPYVDGAEGAFLVDGGKYFKFCEYDSDYGVHETHGLTSCEEDTDHECANCSTQIPEDDTYCESCLDDSWCCAYCDERYFGDGESVTEIHGDSYCEPCAEQFSHACPVCDDTFHYRYIRHAHELCENCRDDNEQCLDCDAWTDKGELTNVSDGAVCDSCHDVRTKTEEDRLASKRAARGSVISSHKVSVNA